MDQETRAAERIGLVLRDKLQLDKLLGVGGMAAVYSATHRNSKRVAVKLLHHDLSTNLEARTRFLREGYAANQVGHPGAVAVLDDDVAEDGSVFLVMELLEGETAEARCERNGGRLPFAEVLTITEQLLDVLVAAHDKKIIHRDLKPENTFITREGQVKVLDFGIASLRMLADEKRVTQTGASSMGTPAFMAPEQARAQWDEVDARTDLWAVGASMFNLLTGRLVHDAETVNELLLAAMTKPAPRLRDVLPQVPREVASVVDRALAFERDDRWQGAREMQEAVRGALRATLGEAARTGLRLSADPIPVADAAPGAPTGRQSPVVAAAIAGAVVVAGAVAALFALRSPPQPSASVLSASPEPPAGGEPIAAPATAVVTATSPAAAVTPASASVARAANVAPTACAAPARWSPRAAPPARVPARNPLDRRN